MTRPVFGRSFDLGRWTLDPSRFSLAAVAFGLGLALLGPGFAVHLSASEPSISPIAAAAAPAAAPPPRERAFAESDVLKLLSSTLQRQYVQDQGELELRLNQPWKTISVPNEPLTLRILDMPTMGVTPLFIARFELRTSHGTLGTWQASLQAWVWREIWVAKSPLQRGEPLADAAVERERRDVLSLREPLAEFSPDDPSLELAESVQAGAPLLARMLKLRAVLHRGQLADALVQDGALSITMKVEVLEDAAPGQLVRVRNMQSQRDLRGKVLDEHTVLIPL